MLERLVRDTDAWPVFLDLTRGERGNPEHEDQPRTETGRFESRKYDEITLTDGPPATIPIPANRKPPTGTSTSYVLRQLDRGKRLKSGEMLSG